MQNEATVGFSIQRDDNGRDFRVANVTPGSGAESVGIQVQVVDVMCACNCQLLAVKVAGCLTLGLTC